MKERMMYSELDKRFLQYFLVKRNKIEQWFDRNLKKKQYAEGCYL